jgi:hypothetical protein
MTPSKTILEKMADMHSCMQTILRDPRLSARVQIADINTLCWAMVELTHKLQAAVNGELGNTE